jgi:Cellulase N-terminal ig-like domain
MRWRLPADFLGLIPLAVSFTMVASFSAVTRADAFPGNPRAIVIACSKVAQQLTRGGKQDGVTVNEGVTAIFFARVDWRQRCRKAPCFITEAWSALRRTLEFQQMRGHSLMRQLPLCLSILFLPCDPPCWAAEVLASTIVEDGSLLSRSADARSNSGGQSGVIGKLRSGDDKSSPNTTWSQGLTIGVNGPIPLIVVDQFGYLTRAAKIAVIRDPQVGYDNAAHFTPGTTYAVVDQSTGKIIKQGPPTAWNGGATDDVSGDKVWWFDFSDVTIAGTYTIVDINKGLRSVEFQINDRVYRNVLKHAVRMYFYQRAGFKKTAETAGC